MKSDSTMTKVGAFLQSQNVARDEVKVAYRSLRFNNVFVCLDCYAVFEEPYYWEEKHGLEYGPFEKMSGCPYCGGAYVNAHKCDCCENWITGEYIKTDDGERFCVNCYTPMELGDEDN